MTPEKPRCLFIAPLKGDDSATRERSEDVYASLVMPAATQAGFLPNFVLDDQPGTIMNHIVRSIRMARVVVADLTGNNFSVGYELGFAHMLGRPTIALIRAGSAMPFDVQTMRAIEYDYTNRGTLRTAIPQLIEQLTRLKSMPVVIMDNPLQNALKAVEPHKPILLSPPVQPPRLTDLSPPTPVEPKLNALQGFGPPAAPRRNPRSLFNPLKPPGKP